MHLSSIGAYATNCIEKIESIYPSVLIVDFVVMPNHVHMLLHLLDEKQNLSIERVIQQWKGVVSKHAEYSIWQDRFHDHIILTADEYRKIKKYIEMNPKKWLEDRFYAPLAQL